MGYNNYHPGSILRWRIVLFLVFDCKGKINKNCIWELKFKGSRIAVFNGTLMKYYGTRNFKIYENSWY